LAQYKSHVRIAERMLALPDAVLDATPNRRNLLAGFCFLIADRCAQKGDLLTAIDLWNRTQRRGITRGRRFVEGIVMLLGEKRPSIGNKIKEKILSSWPATWRMIFRKTFLTRIIHRRSCRFGILVDDRF
jgi:hypothetical protein